MGKHEILEQKMCKELDELEEKYMGGGELTETDLKRMDILYHTLKNKAKYENEKMNAYGYSGEGGYSGYGGYSGRNYSRDMGPGNSGHYPMMPRYYEPERPW